MKLYKMSLFSTQHFPDVEQCLFMVIGTFPIDTAKTRLQIQGQIGDSKLATLRYRGMGHALALIARNEGFKALYSG